MSDSIDVTSLSDRELAILTYQAVSGMTKDLYGNGAPGLIKEFEALKTTVAERTMTRMQVFGIGTTTILVATGLAQLIHKMGG